MISRFRPLLLQVCWWLLPLASAVMMYCLSWQNTADVPKWDDYPIVAEPLLQSLDGTLTFSDLNRQEVDNRMPFPKLVMVGMARLTHWNMLCATAMTVTFGLAAVIFLILLARRTWPAWSWRCWILAVFIGAFMYSMTSWMIWTYQTFIIYAMVMCATAAQVWVFSLSISGLKKISIGALLAFVACNTFLNGWLTWGVLLWLMLGEWLRGEWTRRGFFVGLVSWGILVGIAAALYFPGYHFNGKPGLLSNLVADPMKYVDFFLRWLGSPIGQPWSDLSKADRVASEFKLAWVAGLCLLAAVVFASVLVWKNKYKQRQAWPWLGLILWGLASGGLVTLGRADLSSEAFFWPRYQMFTFAVYVGLFALIILFWPERPSRWKWLAVVPSAAAGLGLFNGTQNGYAALRADFFTSEFVHSGLVMRRIAPEPTALHSLLPGNFPKLAELADRLEERGFIHPKPLRSLLVRDAVIETSDRFDGELKAGRVIISEGPEPLPRQVNLSGWAVDLEKKQPIDAIAISVTPRDGDEIWYALADRRKLAKKPAEKFGLSDADDRIGWELGDAPDHPDVPKRNELPKGYWVMRAYAYDLETHTFYRLSGLFRNSKE